MVMLTAIWGMGVGGGGVAAGIEAHMHTGKMSVLNLVRCVAYEENSTWHAGGEGDRESGSIAHAGAYFSCWKNEEDAFG